MLPDISLVVLSLAAAFCSQAPRLSLRRYACLFGIASVPFWLWTTYMAGLWSIFIVSWVYAVIWTMGFYHYWCVPDE